MMNKEIIELVKFHSITHGDATELSKLDKECFSVPWSKKSFYNEVDNDMANYVIAKIDEKIIGYIGYWNVVGEGQITNVAVKCEYRRLGIGDALIKRAIISAETKGLYSLSLEVRQSNMAAISLYKKHGFTTVGQRKNYYTNPREDAVLMELIL